MNLEKARELAIKKWQYIVDNDGILKPSDLEIAIPELSNLKGHCSYCELFANAAGKCEGCPIRPKDFPEEENLGCCAPYHPYWLWSMEMTKERAQAVLDLIISH